MRSNILRLVAIALLAVQTNVVLATDIVADQSPATTGAATNGDLFENVANSQFFLDSVRVSQNTLVNGIAIYSADTFQSLGQEVQILFGTSSPSDADHVLDNFLGLAYSTISVVDYDGASTGTSRKFASFPTLLLEPNVTYWFGLTGRYYNIGQTLLSGVSGGDGKVQVWQSGGADLPSIDEYGDLAFRLYFSPDAVPEPGSLALLGLGLAGLGLSRRRKA